MSEKISYTRVCGIDVAKATLAVHVVSEDQRRSLSVENAPEGFARIIKLCQKQQVQLVVFEATGGYQRRLAEALVQAQLPIAVLNPARIRHYALGEGKMAKTDQVDARIIADFALKLAPKPTALRSKQQEQLASLVARKGQLVKFQVAEENRIQQQADLILQQSFKRNLAFLKKEIARIDRELEKLVQADAELELKAQTADQVKSVGRDSAVLLVASLPELGTLTHKQIAALAGLAPIAKDSGKLSGERHIAGGRPVVRSILYMCTLSAICYEPRIKSFYQRLLQAGKCKMKAFTACMHKLLVILNARVRDALAAAPTGQGGAAIAAGGGA
jgi:transposase